MSSETLQLAITDSGERSPNRSEGMEMNRVDRETEHLDEAFLIGGTIVSRRVIPLNSVPSKRIRH